MTRLFQASGDVAVAPGCACCSDRRGFLKGLAAAAAAPALAMPSIVKAQVPRRIIDVHAHLTPPDYIQDLSGTGLLLPPSLNWSPAKHIEDMDRAGVDVTILSVTTPGIWFGDVARARRMARYTNDYGAKLATSHVGRFGQFVAIPLPDADGSMKEIEYGLDTLKADGVALFTSYDGKWLGDPAFDAVFQELNRRKAVVYVHPTSPACCVNTLPYIPDAMIEYGTDTTRAIVNYIFLGAARRYPDVKMIWSHAGGSMPYMIERFDQSEKLPSVRANVPEGFRAEARKFYYDTAQSSNEVAMGGLRKVVPVSQIVFGTDVPFRTCVEHVKALEANGVFSEDELKGIWRGNAQRVIPRLAG
ncbi:MAG: hypothetical protein JWO64_1328 [Hyphomicrobiales bacterium]|jgi:predicted TIM-barrel fold metal-dependent hydrolase|nr:hypothetical protein [Hyphomicrobiales bacterium]